MRRGILVRSSQITRASARCALAIALMAAVGTVAAQQAPAGLDKAVANASKWVAQADANQADSMWKASAGIMQKAVNASAWAKYIADIRQQAGAEQSRSWLGLNKVDNPQGMPPGEYLNVVYATKFANAATVETVSMAKDGSSWQPVGYIVRPAQTAASAKQAAGSK